MSCNTNQIEELVKKIVAEYNTTGAKTEEYGYGIFDTMDDAVEALSLIHIFLQLQSW